MESKAITPDYIRNLTEPTKNFLCALKDNTYNVNFGAFRIRDMISGMILVDVRATDLDSKVTDDMDPSVRQVRYHFGPDFFALQTIGLQVEFTVGDKPIPNMLMVERHYFRGKCIKSYEFKFGFCMPNTTNTLEMIYDLP
jgi:protein unc-119